VLGLEGGSGRNTHLQQSFIVFAGWKSSTFARLVWLMLLPMNLLEYDTHCKTGPGSKPRRGGGGGASTELRNVSFGINEIGFRKSRILDILCK